MQELQASAEANPYAAPEVAEPPLAPAVDEQSSVTPRMVLLMRQSAPWVFFLSVTGFLFTGLFGLGMLTNFMLGFLTFRLELGDLIAMATIVLVIVAGVVLSALLFRYGLSVLRFVSTHSVAELRVSLQIQRTLWRVAALGLLLVLGLLITLIVWQILTPPVVD
jgi:hypothetical protein